jgi:hypothetical protein
MITISTNVKDKLKKKQSVKTLENMEIKWTVCFVDGT